MNRWQKTLVAAVAMWTALHAGAMPLGLRTAIWGRSSSLREADPIPDLGANPSPAVVAAVVGEAADPALPENVADAASYAAYRAWAQTLGDAGVKASPHAWLSFALGTDALITREFSQGDLRITSFCPLADGQFSGTLELDGVAIGAGPVDADTLRANLGKVFYVEGAEGFGSGEFSADAVLGPVFRLPEAGRARFTVRPNPGKDGQPGDSFFIRVKMRCE